MKILTHLGLGDQLLCYGMIKELSAKYDAIELFTKHHNMPTVCDLYAGTNIYPIAIDNEVEANEIMKRDTFNCLTIGYGKEDESLFGEQFHKDGGVLYATRWKHTLPIKTISKTDVIVLDTPDYPINIEGKRLTGKPSLFDYLPDLQNAREIHLIESSFKLFIELLSLDCELHYHYKKEKSWRIVPSKHNYIIHGT